MTTTDLRPWAIAILATVYAVVFWVFQARVPPAAATGASRPIGYDELAPGARPDVRLPPGWTFARAGDPPPTRVAPARMPRIRTRSS